VTNSFGSGPGSSEPGDHIPSTNGEEPLDPLLADRFRLLDQVDPPAVSLARRLEPSATVPPVHLDGQRSGLIMATAAAAVVVLIGLSALVVASRNSGSDVEAATAAGIASDRADADSALDDEGEAPTSEAVRSTEERASGAVADADQAALDLSDEAPTTTGRDVTANLKDTTTVPPTTEQVETTVVTEPPTSETTSKPPSTPLVTMPPVTEPKGETTTSPPTSKPDSAKETVVIRGKVNEVFTDCQSRLVLNQEGKVESLGPISCDGGSYIMVDGIRIQTSSGYVPAEMAFNKHPDNLRPGQQVMVVAMPYPDGGGLLTLDCDSCRVRVSGKGG